jgi:glyoxalase family protein
MRKEQIMELSGIHHVTAVSGSARTNLDFYTRVLGLRLVKKSVNQDVITTYHLFYADEVGHPGTDMTFFEWPNAGPHHTGSGDVSATAFAVPNRTALEWWVRRFDEQRVEHGTIDDRGGRTTLSFADPEGQRLELVVGERRDVTPWRESSVPEQVAIHGFAAVRLLVDRLEPSAQMLTELLGFRQVEEYTTIGDGSRRVLVFETGAGGIGTEVHVEEERGLRRAHVGIGGVHHVAFRTPNSQEHEDWRERIAQTGVDVTPVIDRYYFRSIYFREPGGVLFEIATDGPGFTADEDVQHLGEQLSLPPFLESQRAYIESRLHPIELASVPTGASE